MIRLADLSARSSSSRLDFDMNGDPTEWAPGPDAAVATVYVDSVTDAVRSFRDGALDASLDRNQIWAVCGFSLSREMVAELPENELTAIELLEAVREAGHEWTRVRISSF